MGQRYYFLLTALPPLPELGGRGAIELTELHRLTRPYEAVADVVDAILLQRDLLLREAVLAGETIEPEALVLTDEQVRGEQPLGAFLTGTDDQRRRIPADAVWEAYYRRVLRVAGRRRCDFLRAWVGFEVALRNGLAIERAKTLQLEADPYLVAPELADPNSGAHEVAPAWTAAPDPLAGLRVVDEARARWTIEKSRYFSFSLNEVAAYAEMLVLVARWDRIAGEDNQTESNRAA